MTNSTYYTLLQRDEHGLWWPQFGDYSKAVVEQERRDWIESGTDNPSCLKVVRTIDDSTAAIDAVIARLSGLVGEAAPRLDDACAQAEIEGGVIAFSASFDAFARTFDVSPYQLAAALDERKALVIR